MEIENVRLDFLGHAGFLITIKNGNEKKIVIDPYNLSENASKEKADIILITHSHYDHCSIKDIEKVKKEGTVIICPADVQSKITRIENVKMELIEEGEVLENGKIKIEAIPAYNTNEERHFHTKKDLWIGYLIKFDNIIIYHSGDSDKIPEMDKLTGYGKEGNHFIALLPVSGKFVMNPEEAAEVASCLNANIVIPMHYGADVAGTIEDAQRFVEICKQEGIDARILDKI
jgi:L-ascorbate metabolism protein UlaG (beta-lactamase superfamily)